jgi:hypothetical protein
MKPCDTCAHVDSRGCCNCKTCVYYRYWVQLLAIRVCEWFVLRAEAVQA